MNKTKKLSGSELKQQLLREAKQVYQQAKQSKIQLTK